jgi:1,4-alpha-glucan branching enzyme
VEAQIEQRLMSFFLGDLLQQRNLARNPADPAESISQRARRVVDNITTQPAEVQAAHAEALERTGSAFALMLTSVGIPMFLAGEEFGDIHDLEHSEWRLKMSDPVDFTRRDLLGHRGLLKRVQELTRLRAHHPGLQRNEVQFFYHHPTLDENDGVRVFACCRTNGQSLGSANQVIILANCGPHNFPVFDFPSFWDDSSRLQEHGTPAGALSPQISNRGGSLVLSLSLAPFQVRVFST